MHARECNEAVETTYNLQLNLVRIHRQKGLSEIVMALN